MRAIICAKLRFVSAAFLLLAGLALGGSGSRPDFELTLIATALVCLLGDIWISIPTVRDRASGWFIVLVILIPILQLVPIPLNFWVTLPQGRFAQAVPYGPVSAGAWRTISISPDDTLYSALTTVPPLVEFWLVAGITRAEQVLLTKFFVVAVLCFAILGIAQASGVGIAQLYENSHQQVATGLFANRNHFADLLILGGAMLLGLEDQWLRQFDRKYARFCISLGLLLLLAGVVGSASRTGLIIFLIIGVFRFWNKFRPFQAIIVILVFFYFVFSFGYFTSYTNRFGFLGILGDRFSNFGDARWEIWWNSLSAAKAFFPFGSGEGTFARAYKVVEPISSITPVYINSSHNEYLQIIIEGGFLSVIILAVISWLLYIRFKVFGGSRFYNWILFGVIAISVHSLFDYPLRVMAISIPFFMICAFLFLPIVRR